MMASDTISVLLVVSKLGIVKEFSPREEMMRNLLSGYFNIVSNLILANMSFRLTDNVISAADVPFGTEPPSPCVLTKDNSVKPSVASLLYVTSYVVIVLANSLMRYK